MINRAVLGNSLGFRNDLLRIRVSTQKSQTEDGGKFLLCIHPLKTIRPLQTGLHRGGFLSFQVKVTSNQLWNTNYSAYQTYLHSRIVALKEQGLGYRKIAKQLNSEGVKTLRGKQFLPASVHSILKKKNIREERLNREPKKEVSKFKLDPV